MRFHKQLPDDFPEIYLVGGFNPLEKYDRQNGFIFPNFRGENKKCLSCHHLVYLPTFMMIYHKKSTIHV